MSLIPSQDKLTELNNKPFQKLEGSRASLFEALDKPALKPLPLKRYEYAEWKKAKVNIDYHVQFDDNYYSVPYQLAKEYVDLRVTATTVEVLYKGKRVASHMRLHGKGKYSTEPNHCPAAHRKYMEWTPSRLLNWAQQIGPYTSQLVKTILDTRPHPEQGYRSCLGIIRLGEKYPKERMEAAAKRALEYRAISYGSMKSILEKGLDQVPQETLPPNQVPISHANIRGPEYYTEKGV